MGLHVTSYLVTSVDTVNGTRYTRDDTEYFFFVYRRSSLAILALVRAALQAELRIIDYILLYNCCLL
jgi:hypothetical protein